MAETGKQGFASMDEKKQRDIASEGGKASSGSFEKGSERAADAGQKGGSASSGGTHEQHVKAGEQSHKNT